jgi:hypothetical protein
MSRLGRPGLVEEEGVVLVRENVLAVLPRTPEARAVTVAAADRVGARERDNLLIVEAHAAEDVAQVRLFRGMPGRVNTVLYSTKPYHTILYGAGASAQGNDRASIPFHPYHTIPYHTVLYHDVRTAPCAASGRRSSGVNRLSFSGAALGCGASVRPERNGISGPPIDSTATQPAREWRRWARGERSGRARAVCCARREVSRVGVGSCWRGRGGRVRQASHRSRRSGPPTTHPGVQP